MHGAESGQLLPAHPCVIWAPTKRLNVKCSAADDDIAAVLLVRGGQQRLSRRKVWPERSGQSPQKEREVEEWGAGRGQPQEGGRRRETRSDAEARGGEEGRPPLIYFTTYNVAAPLYNVDAAYDLVGFEADKGRPYDSVTVPPNASEARPPLLDLSGLARPVHRRIAWSRR